MNVQIRVEDVRGRAAFPYVDQIAHVRIRVFRDFPYLYKGDVEYERKYLQTYFSSEHSYIALAFDGDKVIGASTAVWMPEAEEAFRKPFSERGYDVSEICYYGESVLLSDYRGMKLGAEFMKRREAFARSIKGVNKVAFCAVIRPKDHPLRPKDYRPLDEFWNKVGFNKIDGMVAKFSWQDVDQANETEKELQFWLKELR